jgi:hypothetical protein
LKYLNSNIFFNQPTNNDDITCTATYLIEFNVIYSEVYQMPTAYFTILNLENNSIISFDDFLKLQKYNSEVDMKNNFVSKGYEISKTVKLN